MPVWSIIAIGILRLLLAMAPHLGFLNSDEEAFNLRNAELEEAREMMDVINSRLILVSWPPIVFLSILARSEELCLNGTRPLNTFILIALCGLLALATTKLKARIFRGIIPPLLIAITTISLDTIMQLLFIDNLALYICWK